MRSDCESRLLSYFVKMVLRRLNMPVSTPVGVEALASCGAVKILPDRSELLDLARIVSLQRELDTGRTDQLGRFDESAVTWHTDTPVVDRWIAQLSTETPEPSSRPAVVLTHDVDWVSNVEPIRLARYLAEAARATARGTAAPRRLLTDSALHPDLLVQTNRRMMDLEDEFGARSVFFFMSGGYSMARYGARYSIESRWARKFLADVLKRDRIIGLHSSVRAFDAEAYASEKESLERASGVRVVLHRSHYLRFDPTRSWRLLHSAGLQVDFTVGYWSRMGFRAGTCHPYRPFDWESHQAADIIEVPLVYMDRLDDVVDIDRTARQLGHLFDEVQQHRGTVSILIHPDRFAEDERWFDLYEAILQDLTNRGVDLNASAVCRSLRHATP